MRRPSGRQRGGDAVDPGNGAQARWLGHARRQRGGLAGNGWWWCQQRQAQRAIQAVPGGRGIVTQQLRCRAGHPVPCTVQAAQRLQRARPACCAAYKPTASIASR